MSDSPATVRWPGLLLMVTVVAAWLAWTARPLPAERSVSPKGARIDAALAGKSPRVLVLGNSIAHVGLDHERVARALGVPDDFVRLTLDGSTGMYWYAVLRNHVYGAGLQPELVLIPNIPGFALRNRPLTTTPRNELAAELSPDDTALLARLHGGTPLPPPVQRFLDRRTVPRDRLLEAAKAWSVGLLLAPAGPGTAAAGLTMAEPALERVFGAEGAVDLSLHARAMPIAQFTPTALVKDPPLSLAGSTIPDLLALAEANGTRVLFVELPVRDPVHAVPVEARGDLIAAFNDAPNGGYVDLSGLAVPAGGWADDLHLNATGRARATDALLERLAGADLLADDAALPRAMAPLTLTSAARAGVPPVPPSSASPHDAGPCCLGLPAPGTGAWSRTRLDALGLSAAGPLGVAVDGVFLSADAPFKSLGACDAPRARHQGDSLIACVPGAQATPAWSTDFPAVDPAGVAAWWVPPGTTATLELPPLGAPGALVLRLLAFGVGAEPTLTVDGAPARLARAGTRRDARVPRPPDAPTTLRLASPPDGPLLWIDALAAVQEDGGVRPVIGDVTRLADHSVELLEQKGPDAPAIAQPPVRFAPDGPPVTRPDGLTLLPSARAGALSDAALVGRHVHHSCGPVVLERDGAPLPGANTPRSALAKGSPGWVAVAEGALLRGDPAGVAFALQARPDTCKNQLWLHAGGRATVHLEALDAFPGPARALAVRAEAHGPGRPALTVAIEVGGETVLTGALGPSELAGEHHLSLPRPLPPWTRDLTVTLTVPDDGASISLIDVVITEAGVAP